jgi:hypothetical protein
MSLSILPNDAIKIIAGNLYTEELGRCRRVSKVWNRIFTKLIEARNSYLNTSALQAFSIYFITQDWAKYKAKISLLQKIKARVLEFNSGPPNVNLNLNNIKNFYNAVFLKYNWFGLISEDKLKKIPILYRTEYKYEKTKEDTYRILSIVPKAPLVRGLNLSDKEPYVHSPFFCYIIQGKSFVIFQESLQSSHVVRLIADAIDLEARRRLGAATKEDDTSLKLKFEQLIQKDEIYFNSYFHYTFSSRYLDELLNDIVVK